MQKGILLIICFISTMQVRAADTCKALIKANFDVQDVCLGNESVFNNSSQSDSLKSSYIWKFGDGDNSTQRHPNHAYKSAGTYMVELIANLNNGCADTILKILDVFPLPYCGFAVSSSYKQNQYEVVATPKQGVMPSYEWMYLYTQKSSNQILTFLFPIDSMEKNFRAEKIILKVTNQFGCSAKDSINTIFARIPEGSIPGISNNNIELNFNNPSPSNLSIFNKGMDYQFQLTDISGRLVKSGVLMQGNNIIEIKDSGIYLLTTTHINGYYFVNKIVIN